MTEAQIKDIEQVLINANWLYHNGEESPLSDDEFDALCNKLKAHKPDSPVLTKIGAPLTGGKAKAEVSLPFHMGSLEKVKPAIEDDVTVTDWVAKRTRMSVTVASALGNGLLYIVMPKLDGVSLQIRFVQGKAVSAYTRGDGEIGGDVTYLLPFMRLPTVSTDVLGEDFTLRAEMVMPLETFAKKWAKTSANTRNQVAGFTTCQDFRPAMLDVEVVFYEVIATQPESIRDSKTPLELLTALTFSGLNTVKYQVVDVAFIRDDARMTALLEETKVTSRYDIDGLVILENLACPRSPEMFPEYSVAFKVNKSVAVNVVGIEWNVSKDGLAKPRVQVEPVKLSGATVTYATGFHAKFVIENGIGPGAVVMLTRSGEVIPDITGVVTKVEPQLPDNWQESFEWTPSGVDLVLKAGVSHAQQDLNRLVHFCATLGWEGWKEGVLAKVMATNADISPLTLCQVSAEWLKGNVAGVKDSLASKLVANRDKAMSEVNLATLVDASGIFGRNFGTTRAKALLDNHPDWLALYDRHAHVKTGSQTKLRELVNAGEPGSFKDTWRIMRDDGYAISSLSHEISQMDGFAEVTATQFATNLPKWLGFYAELSPYLTLKKPKEASSSQLAGQVICMSGFRDKDLTAAILDAGGVSADSFTSKVTILVVKDTSASSSKIDSARAKGVPVLSRDEFIAQYMAA